MNILDKIKGYRTVIVNAVGSAVGFAVGFGWVPQELADAIAANADQIVGAILALWGSINVFLRFKTDTKIGEAE
jgi:hypothetical protein